jgi:RND family efflux transporter MFP subunit
VLVGLSFLFVVVLLMIWLAGGFHPKIDDGPGPPVVPAASDRTLPASARTVAARVLQMPRIETAVGTVRAVHEAAVASKLLAKVIEVNVTAGKPVKANDVLIRLDDADLRARAEQAEAMVRSAESQRGQARIEFDRIEELARKGAASKIELDRVSSALATAEAELQRAEQAATEAQTVLSYATVRAPMDGVVIDKRVEAGDTVTPGQILLTLFDPTRMQLVASVRESLTHRLKVGQTIGVRIDSLTHTCDGRVSEIVPEAESASRTFAVKVTGPCPPGVYSGMFGRLLIPLDDESVLVIPNEAVRRVGQLELIDVVDGARVHRRAVKLGRSFGDDVEVLSGLRAGEQVLLSD